MTGPTEPPPRQRGPVLRYVATIGSCCLVAAVVLMTVSWADDSRADWWWQVALVLLFIALVAQVIFDRLRRD